MSSCAPRADFLSVGQPKKQDLAFELMGFDLSFAKVSQFYVKNNFYHLTIALRTIEAPNVRRSSPEDNAFE